MKKSGTKIINRVHELEELAPPVSPIEALRRNLLYNLFQGVTGDDIKEIVEKQTEKAKSGDSKAAKLLIDMIQAGSTERSVTHMQQAVVVDGTDKKQRFLSETREQIVSIIAAEGPKQSARLAELLHAPLPHILEALNDHEWFEKKQNGWHVTDAAYIGPKALEAQP